jgi:hypothetical protein
MNAACLRTTRRLYLRLQFIPDCFQPQLITIPPAALPDFPPIADALPEVPDPKCF